METKVPSQNGEEDSPFFQSDDSSRERYVFFQPEPGTQIPKTVKAPEPRPMPRSRSQLGSDESWIPGEEDTLKRKGLNFNFGFIFFAASILAAMGLIGFVVYRVFEFYGAAG